MLNNICEYFYNFLVISFMFSGYLCQNVHYLDSLNTSELYDCNDQSDVEYLPRGDSNYLRVSLGVPINFYSEKYDHIYINTNGILTFGNQFSDYLNQPFPLEYASIAPFFSNVDTTNSGTISFCSIKSSGIVNKAAELVRLSFKNATSFTATAVYIASWVNVGYYNEKSDKVNTYQVAIITNEEETFVQLIYPQNGLNWLQAEAGELGLPDIRAQVGFNAEDGRLLILNGSATDNVRHLSTTSNIGTPGVWMYFVGRLDYADNVQEPNNIESSYEVPQPRSCSDGFNKQCHSSARCIDDNRQDNIASFCCQCFDGFYGNGFSCIKNNVPIRVTGSISGMINGKPIDENAKLQSYIVMNDGRSYTAINPISPEFGHQLELVLPIGSAIGWLFAKPTGDSENGYQLTGGKLSHNSVLSFKQTGEVFNITQRFEGLNIWDQLTVKIEISGNLPNIPLGSKLQKQDYIEEYNFISESEIRSISDQSITIANENRDIEYGLEQIISFKKCILSYDSETRKRDPILQKISKVVLDYNNVEQAIRIGLLTKVGIDSEANSCTEANCGENMVCMVDGDNYDCVCKNGFEQDVSESNVEHCVDIDECRGPNICSENAYCVNTAGGFNCICYEGFEGNGIDCIQTNYTTEQYNECEKCSQYALCVSGICQCRDGWSGDGLYCTPVCQENETWVSGKCVSSHSFPESNVDISPNCDEKGECSCPENYEFVELENVCRYENYEPDRSEEVPCDVEFNCYPHGRCIWSDHEYRHVCICPTDYQGDGYICSKIEETCTTKPELCDSHALCIYNERIGKSECKCELGYEGNGFICQLAPDCKFDSDCNVNSLCSNGICVCLDGYERDLSDFCVPVGKCGGTYCADNAICKFEPMRKIQYCECLPGYVGDGVSNCKSIPPPCNIQNNCGLFASCLPVNENRYECVCSTGFYGDGYVCVEEKNCRNTPNLCDDNAKCDPTSEGQLSCICNLGFIGNGSVCKEIKTNDFGFLLISQGVVIIRVPFSGKLGRPITAGSMAIGLDKDCIEGRVYWGDISTKKIFSAKYDGTDSKPFITTNIESPEGVAIDWISRRIYWTDSNKDTIEVASLDNPDQRAVIVNKFLVNPRGIAIDPFKAKLYWSDWNRELPKIEMSNLDGTEREILVSKPDLVLPNSIVVLKNTGELCYADAGSHKIACLDVNTRLTRLIASNLSYPFGLTSTDDHFYWTDWTTKQIESVDVHGTRKSGMRTPVFGSHKMYGMTAITEDCPMAHSHCTVNNGGCSDGRLCLVNNMAPSGRNCKCTKSSKLCDLENHVDF